MRYSPFLTRVWRHIVQNGDILVDATCGNGYDTLAMVKMVADKSSTGRVYAMDIQKAALESTSYLLDESLDSDEVLTFIHFSIVKFTMQQRWICY